MQTLHSYLEGRWVTGTGARPIVDATTGAPVAQAGSGGLDLGAALAWGRRVGGPALRALSFAERGARLKAMGDALHTNREALIDASRQGGTTRSDAKFDIDGAAGTLAYYAHLGGKLGDARFLVDGDAEPMLRSKRFVGQHLRLPRRGIAVHINAFNFPAWGMAEKAAVALLAGVPVLSKPGTPTAVLAVEVAKLWEGLLPEGAFQLLVGGAGDLLEHLGPQDCVAFTGGSETARAIRSHPAIVRHHVAVNIEADSLNASVLGPDVQPGSDTFQMFVADVARDMTQKCGQKCTAVRRVMVPRASLDAVHEALVDRLAGATVGDPAEKSTTVGPLASPGQRGAVAEGLRALEAAATPVWRGSAPEGGCFVAPGLFLAGGGARASFVHEHEVFGPVATLLPWDGDVPGLVEMVAAGGGGLVCSVYSDDLAWAGDAVLELAPWHGRVHWGSEKVHDQSPGPGTVLPNLIHGGPGKAGGGSELGGLRGLEFYMPRVAIQADQGLLKRVLGG